MSFTSPVSHALLQALRAFTHTITNPYDTEDLLHRLTDHAVELTDSQGAGVMLAGPRGLAFAAAFDDEVIDIELTQDRMRAGPCFDAFTRNQLQTVPDLTTTDAWPGYRERALEHGFRSVLGMPLNAAGQTVGVLNIYRRYAGPWSRGDIDAADVLASMAAAYVLHAGQSRSQHHLAEQLRHAVESRDLIGQAKGILMERHGVRATEAFDILRTRSQNTNTKLRDVAEAVVREGSVDLKS